MCAPAARNVQHSETQLCGVASHRATNLGPYDNQGPWSYVTFYDLFACWVPDSMLIERV